MECVELDDGSSADDGTGGGCAAAGVDEDGTIVPYSITVVGERGGIASALVINSLLSLSNAANAYFEPLARAIGVVPQYMEQIPPSTGYVGITTDTAVFAGSILLGPGGRAGRTIRLLERGAAGTVHLEVRTARGAYEVIANLRREGTTIILDRAHIEGSGAGQFGPALLRELRDAARQFGREQGASRVIVNPGVRTSGANPGRAMRSFHVEVP
jgi:hypothetical protein